MTVSFDTNHLIAEMEARPILWDSSSKISYQNRDKVKEAWFDLAKAVIPDFDYMKYAKQCEFRKSTNHVYLPEYFFKSINFSINFKYKLKSVC